MILSDIIFCIGYVSLWEVNKNILSYLILSYLILSYLILSYLILPYLILSYLINNILYVTGYYLKMDVLIIGFCVLFCLSLEDTYMRPFW